MVLVVEAEPIGGGGCGARFEPYYKVVEIIAEGLPMPSKELWLENGLRRNRRCRGALGKKRSGKGQGEDDRDTEIGAADGKNPHVCKSFAVPPPFRWPCPQSTQNRNNLNWAG